MIQNQLPLIHAIIDSLLFLENSGPEEVDSDSAVRCMENISASLLTLSQSDQLTLRSQIEQIAGESKDPAYKNSVRAIPDNIGLASQEG